MNLHANAGEMVAPIEHKGVAALGDVVLTERCPQRCPHGKGLLQLCAIGQSKQESESFNVLEVAPEPFGRIEVRRVAGEAFY